MQDCPLCDIIKKCQAKTQPNLIHEFPHSYLLFGQHQYYPGYCVLVLKQHARELHQLSATIQNAIWQELMQAGNAIHQVFKPWKLNYASYGNVVEHIHWHIFPRYENDETRFQCPFSNEEKFKNFPLNIESLLQQLQEMREILKR